MGLFKDNIAKPNSHFLIKLGFEFGPRSGPRGEAGFTKTIHHDGEILWITVSPHMTKVFLYNEYSCGGMLWDRVIDIPNDVVNDKEKFIDWLDEII